MEEFPGECRSGASLIPLSTRSIAALAAALLQALLLCSCSPAAHTTAVRCSSRSEWESALAAIKTCATEMAVEQELTRLLERPAQPEYRIVPAAASVIYVYLYRLDQDWQVMIWLRSDGTSEYRLAGLPELKERIGEAKFPYVRMVHQARGLTAQDFNPALLIRAVNGLRELGKDGALDVLRTYGELAGDREINHMGQHDLDSERVIPIILALFVPAEEGGKRLNMCADGGSIKIDNADDWPLFPLALQDDVPFMLDVPYRRWIFACSPKACLDYAKGHCQIRPEPLAPRVPPGRAADALLRSPQWKRVVLEPKSLLSREYYASLFRKQARRMAEYEREQVQPPAPSAKKVKGREPSK